LKNRCLPRNTSGWSQNTIPARSTEIVVVVVVVGVGGWINWQRSNVRRYWSVCVLLRCADYRRSTTATKPCFYTFWVSFATCSVLEKKIMASRFSKL
jgi:hypothetical protein